MTLYRVLTTRQDPEEYRHIFETVFVQIRRCTFQSPCFQQLHGSGFEKITLNMSEGQRLGMVRWLESN